MTSPGNTGDYLSAVLEIEWKGVTWIGRPLDSSTTPTDEASKPQFLNSQSMVITAWNPNGEVCTAEENARLNVLLRDDLEKTGMTFFECLGRDDSGQHFEESFLVICSEKKRIDEGLKLAQKYSQEAVFIITGRLRSLRFLVAGELEIEQNFKWSLKLRDDSAHQAPTPPNQQYKSQARISDNGPFPEVGTGF